MFVKKKRIIKRREEAVWLSTGICIIFIIFRCNELHVFRVLNFINFFVYIYSKMFKNNFSLTQVRTSLIKIWNKSISSGNSPLPLNYSTNQKKWLKILFKFDNKISDSFCVIYDWIFEGNLNAVGVLLVYGRRN